MKKTIVVCDRCGDTYDAVHALEMPSVVINEQQIPVAMQFGTQHSEGHQIFSQSFPMVDLCPNCQKSFGLWWAQPERRDE